MWGREQEQRADMKGWEINEISVHDVKSTMKQQKVKKKENKTVKPLRQEIFHFKTERE